MKGKRYLTAWALVLVLVIGVLLLPGCTAEPATWTIRLDGIEADTIRYSKGTVNYQVSVIERDGKFGLIDYEGNIVVPIEYDAISLRETEPYGDEMVLVTGDYEKSYCFAADGTATVVEPGLDGWGYEGGIDVYWYEDRPLVLDAISGNVGSTYEAYAEHWYPHYGSLGTIALTAPTVVPVQQLSAYMIDEESSWYEAELISEKYALLDLKTGKLLTEFVYDDCHSIGMIEGVLPVKKGDKWGYVNDKGKELTEFIYDASEISDDGYWSSVRMYAFTNGYTVVRQGDKWGLIDKNGNTVVEPVYEDISQVNDKGLFWIKRNGQWAVAEIVGG